MKPCKCSCKTICRVIAVLYSRVYNLDIRCRQLLRRKCEPPVSDILADRYSAQHAEYTLKMKRRYIRSCGDVADIKLLGDVFLDILYCALYAVCKSLHDITPSLFAVCIVSYRFARFPTFCAMKCHNSPITYSLTKTVTHAATATIVRSFFQIAMPIATASPIAADIMLLVAYSAAGKVMAVRTVYGM